jgi:hypothetical protein
MSAPPPPPGWYPDPSGAPGHRYWDGSAWTHFESRHIEPERNRPKLVAPLLVVAAVLAVVLSSMSGDDSDEDSASTSSSTTLTSVRPAPGTEPTLRPTPTVAPPGSAVRDGKFEFQVLDVRSRKTVGDPTGNPYMTVTAQSTFLVITLSVRNTGNEPQNFFGQNQKLIDVAGREYAAETRADMYMNTEVGVMGTINPGNAIEVKLAFDIQVGTPVGVMELHDSMFSGGAKVALQPPGP